MSIIDFHVIARNFLERLYWHCLVCVLYISHAVKHHNLLTFNKKQLAMIIMS